MSPTRRAPLVAALFGLCVAGTLSIAIAAWVLPDDRAIDPDATSGLGWLAALVIVMSFVFGAYWWSGGQSKGRTVSGLLAALAFAGVALRCGFIVVAEHRSGLVGRTPLVALYGAALGIAGAVLAVAFSDTAPHSGAAVLRRSGVALGVVIILVAVGFAIPTPVTWGQVSQPSAAMRKTAVPRSVSKVSWRDRFRLQVDAVVRVTGGVAALTGDQVVGISGSSGERTWTFQRAGAEITALQSNGDSRVLVTWTAVNGPVHDAYLTVLDGATGRVLFTGPQDLWGSGDHDWHVIGEQSVVVHRSGQRKVVGYSLDSGKRRWTWSAQAACHVTDAAARTTTGVVFEQQCGDHGQLIAVDAAGSVQWRMSVQIPKPSDNRWRGVSLASNTDGTLLTVQQFRNKGPVHYLLIDARTGSKVADRRFGQRLYGPSYAIDRLSSGDVRDMRTGKTVFAHFDKSVCDGTLGSVGTDLPGGFACLAKSSINDLKHSGRAIVTMQSWGGATKDFRADLGAPIDVGPADDDPRNATLGQELSYYAGWGGVPLRVVAAQGAVVIWAPWSKGAELIGLH